MDFDYNQNITIEELQQKFIKEISSFDTGVVY